MSDKNVIGDVVYRVDALEAAKELDDSRACFGDTKSKAKEKAAFYIRSQYEQIEHLTTHAKELQFRIEALEQFERACYKWIEKTEWVQETVQPKELGKHRADVLRERIEALEKDAARYRWLRKGSEVQGDTYYSHSGVDLDLAIDTAMQSEEGGV